MNFFNHMIRKKWFQLIITLLLAIALFVYVNGTIGGGFSNNRRERQRQLITTQTTYINVPVNLDVNENRYYISGVPQTIRVQITGPSGLITAAQNSSTIRATVDLSHPRIGSQRVPISITGLSNSLIRKTDPSSLTVNVSRRVTKTVPVQATYSRDNIANRYLVSGFRVSRRYVRVAGPSDLIRVVDHVSASLPVPANTRNSISQNVSLRAIDRNGSVVSVEIDPDNIQATLDITSELASQNSSGQSTKIVSLSPRFTGSRSVSNYNITLSSSTIQITGSRDSLNRIDSIPVNIDLSQVGASGGVIDADLSLPRGVSQMTPRSVEVSVSAKSSNSSSSGE